MGCWSISLLVAIGVLVIVHRLFKNFNFFKRNGLVHVPAVPLLGSFAPVIFRQISHHDFILKMYRFQPDAKYVGFYFMTQPTILLREPELIKEIFLNFEVFPDRRAFTELNDPFYSKNLLSLRGREWREIRNLLSHAFTSSKLKIMLTLMSKCAMNLVTFLSTLPADESNIDIKDTVTKYANDVIATCAFGIEIDSMKNPTNHFYVYGKESVNSTGFRGVKVFLLQTFPRFSSNLGLKIVSDHVFNFFKDIITTTVATRDAENISRPDMLQLLMDTRGKGKTEREMTVDNIVSQVSVFLLGSYEPSSIAMSFIVHELTVNQDVQAKLRQEIDAALAKSQGQVTYEAVNQLKYLNAVIHETLRLHPPNVFLERMCDKPFELPPALPGEKPFVMRKGMSVWFPVCAIQRDEQYWDEPERFCPERYLDNEIQYNFPYYTSFGKGPRMCIAYRFAMMEIKVLLFYLLATCELKPCAKTKVPTKLSKKALTRTAEGGFLNVQRRNDMHPTIRDQIHTK